MNNVPAPQRGAIDLMKKPLVSILIPCFNAEQFIRATIDSAINQTWSAKEIILVDDGSSDNTLSVALSHRSRLVRVYRQRNMGAAAARNHALRQASGDYFQFLDADDLLDPNKIEQQMEVLLADPGRRLSATGTWGRFLKNHEDAIFAPQPTWQDFSPTDLLTVLYREHRMIHPAAWLISREVAEQAGPWDESLNLDDDGEYFCRVALASDEIKYVGSARSYYRSSLPTSLSGRKTGEAWLSQYRSIEYSTVALLKACDTPETRHACANRFQRFVYTVYPDVPELRRKASTWVQRLGGTNLSPEGGPLFKAARRFLGWKGARVLQRSVDRLRIRPQTNLGNGQVLPSHSNELLS